MANTAANAIDWYLDKLNRLHLVPTNVATMLRDISSKHLSDGNFTPRPLTIDNFTDAELDAIHRLAHAGTLGGKPGIDQVSYFNAMDDDNFEYGSTRLGLGKYMSPIRSVSTTIGQSGVEDTGDDLIVNDTYDFNTTKLKYRDLGNGKVVVLGDKGKDGKPRTFDMSLLKDLDALANYMKSRPHDFGTLPRNNPYSRMRDNMSGFGHRDIDPDHQKIKTRISTKDIENRLGGRLGTYDIGAPMSKKEFVWKSIGAGALTGAPIGAALGAVSGALLMLDKKRRKKWFKTILSHMAIGAALSGAVSGGVGGIAANKAWDLFEKQSSDLGGGSSANKKRRDKIKSMLITMLAYGVPMSALVATGVLAHKTLKNVGGRLNSDMNILNTNVAVPMSDDEFKTLVPAEGTR